MDIVLRAVIIYLLVFAFTRALGRRELATLQPFDFILLVVIGTWSRTARSSAATCAASGSPPTTWPRKPG